MPSSDEPPAWLAPRAAYVHVPFCAHHCCYCDFAVAAGRDHLRDRYLDALAMELATLGQPRPVLTIFLGGGTPTHLTTPQLERLLGLVSQWLPLRPGGEFSVEANPGTLTTDNVAVLANHGVNRVSLGAQSFHPHVLRLLERDHGAAEVVRAVEAVREHIPRVSLDLIFGVSGQSVADWRADLEEALTLQPEHLSTYGLTFEKGTRLWKMRQSGAVHPLDEDTELAQYELAMDMLETAGLEHYEISSFARPGQRCRHNQVYWANEAYFGFGVGAASYIAGRRELNTRDLNTYLQRVLAGESAVFQSEVLDPAERARETLALGLRRADGVQRVPFRVQTQFEVEALAGPALVRLAASGHLEDDRQTVRLTRRGKCVADALIQELWKNANS